MSRKLSSPDSLFRIRHSLAHVLTQAVVSLRPGAKRGFGPPTGFSSREELDQHVAGYEARVGNDHKRLGAALDIYVLDPVVGKRLPLWLPNGTAIREELETLASEEEFRRGYVRVATPHITRGALYQRSGHLELYRVATRDCRSKSNPAVAEQATEPVSPAGIR